MSQSEAPPNWKFWHPLPFWKVVLIFAVMNVAVTFAFVALDMGAGIKVPMGASGGVGGLLSVLTVVWWKRSRSG